jgi:glucose-6-phosphate isomerase
MNLLLIGIGGSALGPQFVFRALGQPGKDNPAAQLALAWVFAGNGKGTKNMVVIPYKDRLELFSKYPQQLLMESLGKEKDLEGKTVRQGISVFGNKGYADQHSYIQQLIDVLDNYFLIFIEVLQDRQAPSMEVEPNTTSGDYLIGFLPGTRQALFEKDRESLTLTLRNVTPFSVGVLIALFDRAVGFYASLININAYNQPGVEAGKKAASAVINLELEIFQFLSKDKGAAYTVERISEGIHKPDEIETVFKICEPLYANPSRGIQKKTGKNPFDAIYQQA